jgi:hypothetical protein
MDEKRHKESHNFTWGMIVGGALVFMLTTKKGRELLKELTDGGIDGIEEFIDLDKVKELTREFHDDEEEDLIDEDEEAVPKVKKKSRRLFRGIRK